MRVVLDTNVCLDAFVFGDPRAATLLAAIESGDVEAVTRADCRNEWLAVLDYRALKLEQARRMAAEMFFDRLVAVLPTEVPAVKPPRCRDPDDQKFLELAMASGAAVLFSRDAEVLKLGKRTAREGWFQILKPEDWQRTP
ncbi:putative PIN family toxin of toxin-antitoxin system [Luteibacter sp. 1214]|uniref:putative toxin-antitoxin system toxin component, PIN family n=1 Tax=Luteibacter sp. 1214 TaxID=2817735 RepID=UPI002866CF8B|nr:putative toxin-antitoxin system toxin component, PIN family [Luteibacter sp. 1214]MDR6644244.1 putative PIN family toxin of toxin-antitoxin system [Luteibacter sp. 1214]